MSWTLPKAVLERYLNPVFVETGTGGGGTMVLAADCGFSSLYTIDVRQECLNEAKRLVPSCVAVCGDSRVVLAEVLSSITQSVTFWLDAHHFYDGQQSVTCILEELTAVWNWWKPGSVILADDFRLFDGGGCAEPATNKWYQSCSQSQLLRALVPFCEQKGCSIWFENSNHRRQDIVVCAAVDLRK